MKRRILGILTAVMALTLIVPGSVFAEGADEEENGHNHVEGYCPVCGETDEGYENISEDELFSDYAEDPYAEGGEEFYGEEPDGALLTNEAFEAEASINDTQYETLQEAISAANEGDTVKVEKEITLGGKIIVNGKKLTLTGSKITRGFSGDAMFELSDGAELSLENITLDGASDTYSGYSIINVLSGSTLNLGENAILQNSKASYGGGVFVGEDGKLAINPQSNIASCEATFSGGAVYNLGTVDFENGTIAGCSAQWGGAVKNNGTMNFGSGSISGCYASKGGAVRTEGELNLTGGDIANNSASENGGGVSAVGGKVNLSGSIAVGANTVNGTANNIYTESAEILNLAGDLSETVGVYSQEPYGGEQIGTSDGDYSGAEKIISDIDSTLTAAAAGGILAWASSEPVVTYYTVSFSTNDYGWDSFEPQTVEAGYCAQDPGVPTCDGYEFLGWYSEAECVYLYDFSTPVNYDMTLFAGWKAAEPETEEPSSEEPSSAEPETEEPTTAEPETEEPSSEEPTSEPIAVYYSVYFETNGKGIAYEPQSVAEGGLAVTPANPVVEGYTFGGWFTEAECINQYDFTTPVYSSFVLYAKLVPASYIIAFDANGGSGYMNNLMCTYDVALQLTGNTFTKTNCRFASWNTSADGSGTSYDNLAQVTNLSSTEGTTVTLYAQWRPLYEVIEGEAAKVKKGSETALTFRCDGDYANFTGLKVDGKTLTSAAYTSWSGSTYVSLNSAFLSTLSLGEHTLTFVYNNGSCDTTFELVNYTPQTGDTNNMLIWYIVGGVCVVVIIVLVILLLTKKKRK